jgi:hypothetical protein
LADCDLSTARKGKTMTKHRTGDSEVERDLRKMKTAPQALTDRTMTDFMRDEPSAPAVVDRGIFQVELDALRVRENAHTKESDSIAAARRRLPMFEEDGAQVVGAARDLNKAKAATEQVRKDAATNGGSFELVELDLANLKSVPACGDGLLARGEPFDVAIANAGVMATPFGHTADGFETQFGTNHLGHFVLLNRIASLMWTPGL